MWKSVTLHYGVAILRICGVKSDHRVERGKARSQEKNSTWSSFKILVGKGFFFRTAKSGGGGGHAPLHPGPWSPQLPCGSVVVLTLVARNMSQRKETKPKAPSACYTFVSCTITKQ